MEFSTFTTAEILGPLNEVERKSAPKVLYVQGDSTLLRSYPIVSIVGSRKASTEGLRRAGILARELAERGIVILSGLAEGIDTEAHQATIKSGGKTIAVIGTPLDKFFPSKNKSLQSHIAEHHLLISQFPIGSMTTKVSFPQRNRTMALLSDATVIVEAKDRSGSLHQGWEALRLGRPLVILESAVEDDSLVWPKEFIKYGAFILPRNEIESFIANLPVARSISDVELSV